MSDQQQPSAAPAKEPPNAESGVVALAHDWSGSIARDQQWWVVRLHPGPRPFGDVIGLSLPLWQALDSRWATLVVLEMDEVEFLSSSLMGELVRLYKRVARREGALRLCGLRPDCLHALKTCGLDQILLSAPTRALAMDA